MAKELPPVRLSTLYTVRGNVGAHKWLTERLGVPVKLNYVRESSRGNKQPRIKCVKVAGALMFSTKDLYDWACELGKVHPA
jgi:hypothetical protein